VGQDDGAQGEQGGPYQEDQDEGEIAQGLRDFQDRLLVLFGTTLPFIPRRKILVKEFVTGPAKFILREESLINLSLAARNW
jgi:hypothetical protein